MTTVLEYQGVDGIVYKCINCLFMFAGDVSFCPGCGSKIKSKISGVIELDISDFRKIPKENDLIKTKTEDSPNENIDKKIPEDFSEETNSSIKIQTEKPNEVLNEPTTEVKNE